MCYSIDSCDELGMALRTFDGIFESEREKETFYMELMLRRLCLGGDMADNIGQCRITKNLAYMRRALDSHGRSQGLARGCV